jgi:peptidoglycan/LPS O-acetylase OafA/YrhL
MKIRLKMIQPGKDLVSIELLRGIASLMVCFFHLTSGDPEYLPASAPLKIMGGWGWTGVEIFFIISGFIIPYSMYVKNYSIVNFPTFLKKRIIRIEPPYLISIVLILILNFVSTLSPYYHGAPFRLDWANLAGHLAYLNVFTNKPWLNIIFWSLAIEFQYYILIALIFPVITSPNRYYRLIFWSLFAASSFFFSSYNRFIFIYSPYFILGIVLFQLVCGIISKKEFAVLLLLTMGLLFYKNGWQLTLISGLTLFTILYVNKVPRVFRWLGLISYSLYLIHVPVGGRILNLSKNFTHDPFIRQGISLGALVLSLIVAALYYRFIERTFKSISGSIRYKRPEVTQLAPPLEA